MIVHHLSDKVEGAKPDVVLYLMVSQANEETETPAVVLLCILKRTDGLSVK